MNLILKFCLSDLCILIFSFIIHFIVYNNNYESKYPKIYKYSAILTGISFTVLPILMLVLIWGV